MKKFDAFIKKYEKTSTPSKQTKSISKDPIKSKTNSTEKHSNPIKKETNNITNNKNMKKNGDSNLLRANYNLLIQERKNPKLIQEGPLTRSASKKRYVEASEEKQKIKTENKSNIKPIRSKTTDYSRANSTTKNLKTPYLTKPSYIMKKRLQFKDEKKSEGSKIGESASKITKKKEVDNEEIKLMGKKKQRNSSNIQKTSPDKNKKTKKKYSHIGSKVKATLKNQEDKNETQNDGTGSVSKTKKFQKLKEEKESIKKEKSETIPKFNRTKSNNYFGTRINLKQIYQEKSLNRPKSFRKMKQDKEKQLEKLKNKIKNNSDLKYLGKGKDGLDGEEALNNDVIFLLDPIQEKTENNNQNSFSQDILEKAPFFSEGYYNNLIDEVKSAQKEKVGVEHTNYENINISENLPLRDISTIKPPRPNPTPNRILTNKLTTALKSSFRKKIPLDSEIRMLSQEFRCLLSGKKREIEEPVEKKLNFNEEPKMEENTNKIVEEADENISNTADNLNQEEVEQLENDILLKVLEENFGFTNFRPGQLNIIKNILNNKTTLGILPPGGGKSLCFQLPSLVLEGLTIVISPLLALITDQITRLPPCLSGACLSSFTTPNQRIEIMDAIKSNKIKILFITPERFALENFSEIEDISLICFDEASCASPLVPNFRSAYVTIQNIIRKLKPNVMLFLANNITNLLEENLVQLYKIEAVEKEPICLPKNVKLFVSKDENKLQSLVKVLKYQNFKNIGSTLIFCNLKKTVDKVTSYLNQNGLSAGSYHSGKSEFERQMTQMNFMNDKIKIIVCTMAFSMGISKNDVRLVILYDMPPSTEHFLQQIGRGGRDRKEYYVHVFLNDEDYFIQRNMLYMENIDKAQTMKFVDYLFNLVNPPPRSNKRNYLEAMDGKSPSKIHLYQTDISLPRTVSFSFTNAYEFSGIKKQTQLYVLLSLINSKKYNLSNCDKNQSSYECINSDENIPETSTTKITCLGIGPTVINLRFYKSTPEKLADVEPNIKLILESSREFQGAYRFNTIEVCEKIGITYIDLINYLYHLQSRGEISYETKEEGVFLNIEKIPESFKDIIHFLYDRIQYLINLNLKKLNASYVLLRKFAVNSLDNIPFFKQEKQGPIKCLNLYPDVASYDNEFRSYFEKYFETHDDVVIAGNDTELSVVLPILIIETQREKANISKDIEDMVKKESDKSINFTAVEVVNILFGINAGEGKNPYYSNPLWGKFQQHEYKVIFDMVENILYKVKSEQVTKVIGIPSKKLKHSSSEN